MRTIASWVGLTLLAGCGESREERMRREIALHSAEPDAPNPDAVTKIAADPMRDQLAPLLEPLFNSGRLPDVLDDPEATIRDERYPYELRAGTLAQLHLRPGLSTDDRVRAIVLGVAQADAWNPRERHRRTYPDQLSKIKYAYGEADKWAVIHAFGELALLDFFTGPQAEATIAKLPGELRPAVEKLAKEYTDAPQVVWERWMGIKKMTRNVVGNDEPFRSLLKRVRARLGYEEPAPIRWAEAHDPAFEAWARAVEADDALMALLTNLPELRDREEFKEDTHALWLIEGSSRIPPRAAKVKIDDELGFGVYREDIGGGHNEFVFVFSKKLSGPKLKRAWLRSQIYRHMFADFQMLAAAGTDYEEGIVPDKYDPEYARCGSLAAIDALIEHKAGKHALLADLVPEHKNEEAQIKAAHKCVIERCSPEVKVPDPKDMTDVEGPAPGSMLGLFQMLARFQDIDVDLEKMRQDREKPAEVLDAEAFLKANKNKPL